MPTDVTLRPAQVADLPVVAQLHVATRAAAVPAMPPSAHTEAQTRDWVASWSLSEREVWVAEVRDEVVAYARFSEAWLDDLYVAPAAQRTGVGSALLDLVKSSRPDGFALWVFESNAPARAFYARHGLVELERTDGHANDEQRPDIKVAWPGHEPLTFFRRMIDDIDVSLGGLLARRVALTRAVQDHKRAASAVGDPARDAAREREIVARVAGIVPELGAERVARIMHTIISESLDAPRP